LFDFHSKADCIKIAFFSKDLPSDRPNGVSCQVHRLANRLAVHGHDVTCFSFSALPEDARYRHNRLTYGNRPKALKKFIPAITFACRKTDDFDIVHYHGDDYLAPGSKRRVRTFYGSALREAIHAHTAGRFLYQSLFYFFEILSGIRRGEKVGISQATCKSLPFVHRYIHCGVDLSLYNPDGGKTAHPSILFIGDLDSRKRGAMLLEIFIRHILPAHPSCILSIVGPQPVSGPSVRYLGTIDEPSLIREYRQSWIYCLPSSYEGFGVPAIEAMACATAVAAIDNPGTREIIQHERTGLLANKQSLSLCLNRLLSDSALRKKLGENGLQYVQNHFDIEITTRRYEAIYESMLSVGAR
jgi:glycosyltransferase involved in cell wall biosynthesis